MLMESQQIWNIYMEAKKMLNESIESAVSVRQLFTGYFTQL